MLDSARQRVRQFREATARPTNADLTLARTYLDGTLLDLFQGQEPRDVVHGVRTARWLLDRGHADRELLQAALLHDVGKGNQRTRDRVAYVVAARMRLAGTLARRGTATRMAQAVGRSLRHSDVGAMLLEQAGASPRVVALTRLHHSEPGGDGMLALLQEADAAS